MGLGRDGGATMKRRGRPAEGATTRKIFQLTPQQAEWLEAEARRQDRSEAAVLRQMIANEMEK